MQCTQYMITKEILFADFKGSSDGFLKTTCIYIYIKYTYMKTCITFYVQTMINFNTAKDLHLKAQIFLSN